MLMLTVQDRLWSPYSVTATPCLVSYDYVVHTEDRQELEFFLKINNLTTSTQDLAQLRSDYFQAFRVNTMREIDILLYVQFVSPGDVRLPRPAGLRGGERAEPEAPLRLLPL